MTSLASWIDLEKKNQQEQSFPVLYAQTPRPRHDSWIPPHLSCSSHPSTARTGFTIGNP
jgi:hypothetical protein